GGGAHRGRVCAGLPCPAVYEGSRQQQVEVAELVPEVAAGGRGGVAALDDVAAGDRADEVDVGGLGRVPAGQDAVDGADAAILVDHELGPAVARRHRPV